MTKLVGQLARRTLIATLVIFVTWQGTTSILPILAKNSLEEGVQIFKDLEEGQPLDIWFFQLDWQKMVARDRTSIENYYETGTKVRDEARNRAGKAQKKLNQVPFSFINSKRYDSINSDIKMANDLLEKNRKYYSDLFHLANYYEASTLAIFNLIYYDPSITIRFYKESPNYEILLQRFGLDYDGLQKVEERLTLLSSFKDDYLKDFALPLVKPLTIKAKEISNLAGQQKDSEAIKLAEDFDLEVRSVQEKILRNRQEFWGQVDKNNLIYELNKLVGENLEVKVKLNNSLEELKK